MSLFHLSELALDDRPHVRRQVLPQGFPVVPDGGVFAPLALGDDRALVLTGDGALDVYPTPVQGGGGAARLFRVTP